MSKPFDIEEKGLQEEVIIKYLETHNMAQVARDLDLNYFNLVHYITYVKENHPEWLDEYSEKIKIDVFRILNKYVRKLEKKIDRWDEEGQDKAWLLALKELKGYLATYTESVEKLFNMQKIEEERKLILATIKEEAPDVAMKIIDRLKGLKEERRLLG